MDDPSQDGTHEMVEVASADEAHLFRCPVDGCGREVAFDRAELALTVLVPGDVMARHTGSTAPDVLRVGVA
jgi:hypothetical protein